MSVLLYMKNKQSYNSINVLKKSDPHEHANIKWKECRIDESDLQKKADDHV